MPDGTAPSPGPLSSYQRTFLALFVVTVTVCLAPHKGLPFVLPFVGLIGLATMALPRARLLRNLLVLSLGWAVWTSLQGLLSSDFAVGNALLAGLTHGALLFAFVVPTRDLHHPALLAYVKRVVVIALLVESIVGIVQGIHGYRQTRSFDVANGDFVEGTIHPWLEPSASFANPMYSANLAMFLVAVIASLPRLRRFEVLACASGIVAMALASVTHQLLFLLAAMVPAAALFLGPGLLARGAPLRRHHRGLAGMAAVVLALVLATSVLSPRNVRTMQVHVELATRGRSFKLTLLDRLLYDLPNRSPARLLVGFGPGQMASRAALIGTGMYFGSTTQPQALPVLATSRPYPLERYLLDLWLEVAKIRSAGSTLRPFSSWLAVLAEAGLVGCVLACAIPLLMVGRARRRVQAGADPFRAFAFTTGVGFLFLLGLQEHYWETPQAILPGVMLLQVLFANLVPKDAPAA